MLGGNLLHALTGKAAVVDAAVQAFFSKLGVAKVSPCLPPCFQRFGLAPVGCRHSVEHIVACLVQNTLAVFVQHIFPPLFVSPPAVRLNRANRTHDVKMRIGNAAILLVRLMHSEVRHHAPVHKIVQQKLPCKIDVLLHGKLILQGNVKAIRKLGFLPTLGFFHRVPERFTVCVLWRGVGRQQDFRTDHAAFSGVVAVLAVIRTVQLLPGAVRGSSHGRLPHAALDLRHMKMKECDAQSPPAWRLTASMRSLCASGRAKTCSAKA